MHYLLNGHSLSLEASHCSGCGRCLEVCPHQVFRRVGRRVCIAHRNACMECGACQMNCPAGALSVTSGVGCAQAVIHGMRRKQFGFSDGRRCR